MNVVVEEKRTGELSFGAGFSSVDHLVGQATLTQGNFDITNWPAFTGGGQKFRLALVYGQTRKDVTISLTEPYFFDSRFSVTVEGFYHNTNYTTDPYTQANLGAAIGFRRPLTRYLSVRGEYRLERITISNATSLVYVPDEGTRIRSAVAAGLVYDSRDSVFLTRRGTKVDIGGFVAGGPLGGNTNIYGFNVTASHYISLPYDMILLFNAQVAGVARLFGTEIYHSDALNTNRIVPIEDRLFLGGPNDLRGYDYRFVGPKDPLNNAVGGRSLGRGTIELTVPIIERVRGAAFYDGGFNHLKSYSYGFQDYASDYGIGLRLDLPIGPIRLDYAFPIEINRQNFPGNPVAPTMSKSGRFSFNVGYQF
jgi:outer membrane protein insertion porin family